MSHIVAAFDDENEHIADNDDEENAERVQICEIHISMNQKNRWEVQRTKLDKNPEASASVALQLLKDEQNWIAIQKSKQGWWAFPQIAKLKLYEHLNKSLSIHETYIFILIRKAENTDKNVGDVDRSTSNDEANLSSVEQLE